MPLKPGAKKSRATPPSKRSRGQPAYEATDQHRAQVAAMVIASIDQLLIARCLGISRPTLRRAYRRELDLSYAIILAEIAGKLVTKARNGDLKAQIFYLETHGWVRSERLVVADGGVDDTGIASLSDAEIYARMTKLRRKQR